MQSKAQMAYTFAIHAAAYGRHSGFGVMSIPLVCDANDESYDAVEALKQIVADHPQDSDLTIRENSFGSYTVEFTHKTKGGDEDAVEIEVLA